MNFGLIGKEIKTIRSALNMSQSELSNGICTQSQISKIEKGEVYPLASTLYLIAERLGVDVNHFYDIATMPQLEYVKEVYAQVRANIELQNFQEVYTIINFEKKNPLFIHNRKNRQFLLWHEGICVFELFSDELTAHKLINEALSLTEMTNKLLGEREIEILNSQGVIYFEANKLKEALINYQKGLDHFDKIPYTHEYKIKTRLLYNKAKAQTRLNDINGSIESCRKAIDWAISHDSLYLLGDIYYHLGYNLSLIKEINEAIDYLEKSEFTFRLQSLEKLAEYPRKKIIELK